MSLTRQLLIKDFVSAMHKGVAALFIGAGMSRPAGFVDWKKLLNDCAKEIKLDIDREHDLVAVAQYYVNSRNRVELDRIIKDEFETPKMLETPNHQIIARLPITTIWTTNFDRLLETVLEKEGRKVEVKTCDKDLGFSSKFRDVTLYKMHGDVTNPNEIIICKDDYEQYSKKHPIFKNQLTSDLIDKTFLFLGFSFNDPNLNYMLGQLRTSIDGSGRKHFAVIRKSRLDKHTNNKKASTNKFIYDKNKQDLEIEDLMRYNIETLLIDNFYEVTSLLYCIDRHYCFNNIFVSGSAHDFGEFGCDRMSELCMLLGEMIIDRNFRLISGMGLNIGNPTIQGALLKLYRIKAAKIDDRISLRPFPRNLPKNINENDYYEQYRRDIISKSGITIFIAGTSSSKPVSEGVMQEYILSREMGKIPIPIGVTGFAAQQIWKEMRPDIKKIYHNAVTEKSYDKLNNPSLSNEELLKTVFDIIDRVFASLQSSCLGPKQGKQTDMPICPLVVQNTASNPAESAMSA